MCYKASRHQGIQSRINETATRVKFSNIHSLAFAGKFILKTISLKQFFFLIFVELKYNVRIKQD
jgi:hypothetical protein